VIGKVFLDRGINTTLQRLHLLIELEELQLLMGKGHYCIYKSMQWLTNWLTIVVVTNNTL